MTTGESNARRRAVSLAILAGLFAFAAWPFLVYLRAVPLTPDAVVWIERSALGADGWGDWIFRSSHFVGYRPVTGLSFALDTQLFGFCPTALRATDLALHLLAGGLVVLLARRLGGALPALFAGLVFLAHPATNEVVPFLARRSYSLATVFALAGLLLAHRAAGGSLVRLMAAGPLLMLAMFSHELGALQALASPCVAFAGTGAGDRRRAGAVTAWGLACVALGFFVRQQVLGEEGGYATDGESRVLDVARLYALGLGGMIDSVEGAAALAWLLPAVYVASTSVWLARGARRTLVPLGLLMVLAAYGAVVAGQGVWFPREAYPAAALFALLLGLVASRTWADGGLSPLARGMHGGAQLAILALALVHSPLLHGPNEARTVKAHSYTAFIGDVREDLRTLDVPAAVDVVVPVVSGAGPATGAVRADQGGAATQRRLRVPYRWLRLIERESGIEIGEFAYVDGPTGAPGPRFIDVAGNAGPGSRIQFPDGLDVYVPDGRRLRLIPPGTGRQIAIERRSRAGLPRHVWIYSNEGGDLFELL